MKKRIVEIASFQGRAGIETFLLDLLRQVDYEQLQIDFLVTNTDEGPFDEEIIFRGSKIYRISPLSLNLPALIRHIKEVNCFFKNNKDIDVVHIHGNTAISLLDVLIVKRHGIKKIIGHSHNNWANEPIDRIKHYICKILISKSFTNRMACSQSAWDWMYFGKMNPEMDLIVKNGININKFKYDRNKRKKIRQFLNLGDNDYVIGCVGRFNIQKNHSFLLDSFSKVSCEEKDAKLLLVGEGELRSQIENQILKLGLQDKVILTGSVENTEDYYNAMDLYVMPSIYEGFGIVLIEAQANGLLCIVSRAIKPEAKVSKYGIKEFALEDGPDNLSKMICKEIRKENKTRFDNISDLQKAGFDIRNSTKQLIKVYRGEQ